MSNKIIKLCALSPKKKKLEATRQLNIIIPKVKNQINKSLSNRIISLFINTVLSYYDQALLQYTTSIYLC